MAAALTPTYAHTPTQPRTPAHSEPLLPLCMLAPRICSSIAWITGRIHHVSSSHSSSSNSRVGSSRGSCAIYLPANLPDSGKSAQKWKLETNLFNCNSHFQHAFFHSHSHSAYAPRLPSTCCAFQLKSMRKYRKAPNKHYAVLQLVRSDSIPTPTHTHMSCIFSYIVVIAICLACPSLSTPFLYVHQICCIYK